MDGQAPIIIKKRIVSGGDGHHGGAWKVAYADFVTAMMAFFLLMWLLNATSEDQRSGLADFFDPKLPISRNSAGGAGMLAGDKILTDEQAAGSKEEGVRPKPNRREPGETLGEQDASPDLDAEDQPKDPNAPPLDGADGAIVPRGTEGALDGKAGAGDAENDAEGKEKLDADAIEAAQRAVKQGEADAEQLKQLERVLNSEIEQIGDGSLLSHFSLRVTPEGLVIEIVDQDGEPLFDSGVARPSKVLEQLVDIIVPVLAETANPLAIVGHTDAHPFGRSGDYTNWELSSDRANAARRLLIAQGMSSERIVRVTGKAATEPLTDDPLAPQNRRIAIKLLRQEPGR